MRPFTPADWYWQVRGETRFFSSKSSTYVQTLPAGYVPTRIASEQELWDVLAVNGVPLPSGKAQSAESKAQQDASIPRPVKSALDDIRGRLPPVQAAAQARS